MKYIIMADGKGTRWGNYQDIPKHLIQIGGETLLGRTVRLLNEKDPGCEVVSDTSSKGQDAMSRRTTGLRLTALQKNLSQIISVFSMGIHIIPRKQSRRLQRSLWMTSFSLETRGQSLRLKLQTASCLSIMLTELGHCFLKARSKNASDGRFISLF